MPADRAGGYLQKHLEIAAMPAYQFKGRPEIGCTKASFGGRLTAAASARNAWLAFTTESVSTIVCNNPPINSPIIICAEPATSMRRPSNTMSATRRPKE
jgi:hypothetical protein